LENVLKFVDLATFTQLEHL